MATTQIWRHQASGEHYIVRVVSPEDQTVLEAAGPLYYREFDNAIFDGFDSEPELTEDLNQDASKYVLFWSETAKPCSVCNGPAHINPCVDDAGNPLPNYPRK